MIRLSIPAALRIAWKDLKIFLKERGTLLYLFAIPIAFILAFSGAASVGLNPQEEAINLAVVNLDAGSKAAQTLLDALRQGGGIEYNLYDEAEATALLDKGRIERILIIPASYSEDLQAGQPVTLHLISGPDASISKTEAVYRVVAGVAADLSLETQLIASLRQMADMQAATSPEQQPFTEEIIIEQAKSQFERARTDPLVAIVESLPEHLSEEDESHTGPLSVYVPGFAVLFIFLTAQTTAQSIYEEKKVGSFRRLLAAPISKFTVLVGKMIPNFITGLFQILILFGAGVFMLPVLGFDRMVLGNDPLALVLVCLAVLLCSTSLGVIIAAIARTEGQISGVSAAVLWGLGFAGIFLAQIPSSSFFGTINKAIPHSWANAAFLDLFIRGQGLIDVMPNILVLLGFTVAFFAIGLWRFKFN